MSALDRVQSRGRPPSLHADATDEIDGPPALDHLQHEPPVDADDKLCRAVQTAVGDVFQDGNEIEVLRNGVEIFPAMLEAIEKAESSIDFVTFVYWTGDIAERFAELLARKASEGVRVRVVLDGLGSRHMDGGLVTLMREAGATVEIFRPVVRWKFWEADHRTHRKILVVDGRVGFSGGVGIAEEWEGDAREPSEWRDTHFRVLGPAVLGLRAAFLTDWRDTEHPIELPDMDAAMPASRGGVDVAVIDGSAQIGFDDAERVLEAVTVAAQRRILIQTPYFNPTKELREMLAAAVSRGVAVELLVAGPHIDKRVSDVMAEEMYAPLVESGVRVWRYQPTMMHVKAVLVDGALSIVGSINVNRRSVEKDEEVAMAILDREVTAVLEEHFVEDLTKSSRVELTGDDRRWVRRLLAKLLRPLGSEM